MVVDLVFITRGSGSCFPAGLEPASNLAEQAKPLAEMQVKVAVVALHQVSVSRRAASPGVLAEILPSVATHNTERQIVVFVFASQRDELQPVKESGPAVRTAE